MATTVFSNVRMLTIENGLKKNWKEICFVLAFSNVSCLNGHMGWITNLSNKWSTVYCLVWYENDFIKENIADGSAIELCTGIAAVTAGSLIELFFSFQKNRDFADHRSFYTDLTVYSKIRLSKFVFTSPQSDKNNGLKTTILYTCVLTELIVKRQTPLFTRFSLFLCQSSPLNNLYY